MENQLTENEKTILRWLKSEYVSIVDTGNKKCLTKFGLVVQTLTDKTFNAILPHLQVSESKKVYTLK